MKRLIFAAFLFLTILTKLTVSFAEEPVSPPPVQAASPTALSAGPAEQEMLGRWTKVKEAFKTKDYDGAKSGLEEIRGRCMDLGVTSFEEMSASMIKEGNRLLEAKDINGAMTLFDYAAKLSPNYPPAYYAKGWAYLSQNKLKVLMALDAFIDGITRSSNDFWWSFYYIANKFTSVLFTLAIVFTLFGLFMAARYIPLLAHDIAELRKKLDDEDRIKYLYLPVFFTAALIALGYWWAVTIALLALWVYFSKWEKALAIIFFVLVVFMPEVMDNFASFVQAGGNRMLWTMDDVNKGRAPEGTEQYLKGMTAKKPDDELALASLACLLKKEGRYDEAADLYEKLAAQRPDNPAYRNNLGNVYFLTKDLDKAVNEYKAGVQYGPKMVLPYFNLSQAYGEKLMFTEREQSDRQAREIDPNFVASLREIAGSTPLRMVFDEPLPVRSFWDMAFSDTAANRGLAQSLWDTSVRLMPLQATRVAGIGFIVLALALNSFRKKGIFSHYCQKCGKVSCRKCQRPHFNKELCAWCHQIFVKMEGVEARDRLKKTLEIRESRQKEGVRYRVFSLILPGSGHFLTGRPFKGLVFTGVFVFVIKDLFFGHFYSTPYDFALPFFKPDSILLVVVWVVFYLVAQLDMHRITRATR